MLKIHTRNLGKERISGTASTSQPGPSALPQAKKPRITSYDSDSTTADEETDEEKCIVCKRFSPDHSKKPHVIIVNWGQCDVCGGWVHLSFCTPVRVIRRGDTFTCPFCTETVVDNEQ